MRSRLKKLFFLAGKSGRIKFFILLALMMVNSLLEMVGIGAIPLFIMTVSNPDILLQNQWSGSLIAYLGILNAHDLILWGSVLLIGLFIVKNVFFSLLIYAKTRVIYNEQRRLGNRLFKAYIHARYTFFLNRNSAELLRNVNSETRLIVSNVMIPLLQIIMDGLVLIMIVILLLKVEPLISLLTFAVLGMVSFIFIRITNKRNKSYGKEAQRHRRQMNKIVLEGLSGIKDVKVLGRENGFMDLYDFSALRTIIALRYKQMVNQLPKPFMETIAVTGMLFICLMLLAMNRKADAFLPVLALFGTATVRLLPIFKTILSAYTDIRYNIYAIDPVYNDIKLLEEETGRPAKAKRKVLDPYPFSKQIVLENVSYSYPQSNAQAIRNVSLTIPKGVVIGLVGPSGAGKTTIVDVLLGLLEPQQGRVLADHQDIFEDVRRWQRNVGYVPQVIHLSDDTIRRNIAFGLPDDKISAEQIRQALHAAQLDSLIGELPEGLDTVVGEKGIRLSGGQRQRIGIARALYNNPRVLIMDEATSALDNITEKFVIESIEELRGDRTIIMIAHRLTTVRNCDIIYVMSEGRILEQGNYADLMKNSSAFRKMNLVE